MKIYRIYSNKESFEPIVFNEGFSVVYGDIEDEIDQATGKVSEHNLGKTSLVYLIDFLLLKGVTKKSFFGKHSAKLSGWIFFMEVKLNNGEYLTIRRSVDSNTKISFKKHFSKDKNFVNEEDWDYEDLPLTSRKEGNNPKEILERYLNFNVATDFEYRSFISHLLRTQNDYLSVFKMNKYFQAADKDWKPILFNLLGFNHELQLEKYEKDSGVKMEKKFIAKLQKQGESSEIYKIKAAIEAKEAEKKEVKKEIDNFNFYKKEKSVNFELIKDIESEISRLNKENYSLAHNIDQIQISLDSENVPSIQVEEIKEMFNEVSIFFPDNLAKNYQDVLNFSQQITKERKRYLKEELEELLARQKKVDTKLKELNNKRSESLSLLKEKDSFVKYNKYQEDLIRIEGDIVVYQQKLEGAKTIEGYQRSVESAEDEIKRLAGAIKEEIDKGNSDFQEIKKIFQEVYKKTFEYTALLTVEPNGHGNVEFETAVLNMSKDLTGKGDGYTSTKVLCVSFILSILAHYSSRSFFRFAYCDGLFESWGDNHKIHFLKLIRNYCDKYGIQFIISVIKSDIPRGCKLRDEEVIRVLREGDELFGFGF